MLYQIVRPLAAITFQVFFKKIYICNQERIPRDKAVILAANHPTAFIDPIMVACFQKRRIYTFVRGDAFEKPIFNLMLRDFYMIPIYRRKDGLDQVKQNQQSFEESYRIIQQGKVLMIMAEGGTNPTNILNPIQKAPARVALSCLEEAPELDIEIIPVGVNYTDRNQFRSEIKLVFGESIHPKNHLQQYKQNEQKGIRELTDELSKRLHELVVEIPKEDERLLTGLLTIIRNNHRPPFLPIVRRNIEPLQKELKLAQWVKQLSPPQKQQLTEHFSAYENLLKKCGVTDFSVVNSNSFNLLTTLFLILSFPLFFLGIVLNGLPAILANNFARKKIKRKAYISSIIVGVGLGLYLLYALLLVVFLAVYSPILLLPAVFILPLFGFFSLYFYDLQKAWKAGRQFNRLNKEQRTELLKKRTEVCSQLEAI